MFMYCLLIIAHITWYIGYPGEMMSTIPPMPYAGMTAAPGFMPMMPTAAGMYATTTMAMPQGAQGPNGESEQLKEVDRVRSLFPETWLWMNTSIG